MAWNEPGGNNRDPWGGGGRNQGPPDLDEIVRKLSDKFGNLLGGKRGGGDSGGGGGPKIPFRGGSVGFLIIGGIVFALWLASGLYIVEEGTRGVELRFGRYSDTTMPGLSYHLPYPIESVEVVDVAQIRAEEIGYRSGPTDTRQPALRTVGREALMLTEDENIVNVQLSVQYQVADPRDYLFNVFDPDQTLRDVVESTLREVVGRNSMDFVLTEGRAEVVAEVTRLSQNIIDQYGTGLAITNVNLRDAQPPEPVQPAFADAIKAREDQVRLINEAEAYRNEILPVARGEAARRLEEAEAYRAEVIAQAEGEANRFQQLQTEYSRAPLITRERLYLETIESVLSNTSKVLLDAEGSNNLLYLPLDRLTNRQGSLGNLPRSSGSTSMDNSMPNSSDSGLTARLRDTSRSREMR